MIQDYIDAIKPIKRLIEVYACPECNMAHIYGSATERYRLAQECCAPKICDKCGKGIPKRSYCYPCWKAEQFAKDKARWDLASRVDVATLQDYMIVANYDKFYHDLEEFLDNCMDMGENPEDCLPFIALWRTAPVPDLSGILCDDLPEDHCDLAEIEDYLRGEFEKRKIGAYFEANMVPILPGVAV